MAFSSERASKSSVVSLLPSATEIVYAIGCDDQLRAVTFECDYPVEATTKQIVTGSALANKSELTAEQIDQAISELVAAGESVYTLDSAAIRAISPDVILAQDLCAVCAVPSSEVDDALAVIGCTAQVVSLDPQSLSEVLLCVLTVGDALNARARAREVFDVLTARVRTIESEVSQLSRKRVLTLEWSDPPFNSGHWIPDMITAAGGLPLLASPGEKSIRLEWAQIEAARPDVVLFMPCGYSLAESIAEGRELLQRKEFASVQQFWALAGDAYFTRPGPRVVDGVEGLSRVLHPELGTPSEAIGYRLL